MKKPLRNTLMISGIVLLFLALFLSQATKEGSSSSRTAEADKLCLERDLLATSGDYQIAEEKGLIPSKEAQTIISDVATEVMQALSAKDAEKLAQYVHPEGVRFTPYTYVDGEGDLAFTRNEVRNFFQDQERYLWGYYDGSGEEINLPPGEYYEEFIYSADFINAEQIGYNQVLSSGNMLENQFEVYENPIIVEYYFSGFDPEFMGMDWQSLRLVFMEDENEWKLRGIIHNQWTI